MTSSARRPLGSARTSHARPHPAGRWRPKTDGWRGGVLTRSQTGARACSATSRAGRSGPTLAESARHQPAGHVRRCNPASTAAQGDLGRGPAGRGHGPARGGVETIRGGCSDALNPQEGPIISPRPLVRHRQAPRQTCQDAAARHRRDRARRSGRSTRHSARRAPNLVKACSTAARRARPSSTRIAAATPCAPGSMHYLKKRRASPLSHSVIRAFAA